MRHCLLVALAVIAPVQAAAQTAPTPRIATDVVAGYAGFLDESLIGHTIVSATARYQLTRRVSVGPEVVYMVGPGRDRDLFLTGNAIFDFLQRLSGARARSVNPYLVVGGGLMHHQSQFADFSVVEGAWTAGAGVRVWTSERVYALAEYASAGKRTSASLAGSACSGRRRRALRQVAASSVPRTRRRARRPT